MHIYILLNEYCHSLLSDTKQYTILYRIEAKKASRGKIKNRHRYTPVLLGT